MASKMPSCSQLATLPSRTYTHVKPNFQPANACRLDCSRFRKVGVALWLMFPLQRTMVHIKKNTYYISFGCLYGIFASVLAYAS
eukprot:4375357-Amphidinium_carterae.1